MKAQRFPFALSFWTRERHTATTLRAGEHFRFDVDAVNDFCLGNLPRHLVDLLRVASAVYVVDRLLKRRRKDRPKPAARTIGLKIEVLQADMWHRQEIRDAVHEALKFVTGDFWEIEFEQDPQEYKWQQSCLPFRYAESPLVCLYSGGLDSVAGLVTRLSEVPSRLIIPVTVWHQPRQRHMVTQQHEFVRRHLRNRGSSATLDPLIVKVAMRWHSVDEQRAQEKTQRSRSFLFSVVGAIAAIAHDQSDVEMFESGVGAINPPLMAGMVGYKSTRSSHPEFLRLISKVVSLVAERKVTISLPFWGKTKGELVTALAEPGLRELAAKSPSCVHFPIRHNLSKQCGLCPACILRRVSLTSAGIEEPNGAYMYDILGSPARFKNVPEKRRAYLIAFLLHVSHLQSIEHRDRLPPSLERYVLGTGIVPKRHPQSELIQLLARYRDECLKLISLAHDRGHTWARLLTPCEPQGVNHASA